MTITLVFETIFGVVKRSLSIIGKRSVDDNGNLLFKDITLGTNETEIAQDFMNDAALDLAAELSGFVSGTGETIEVTFPTNHNSNLDTFIQTSCEAYCRAYMLWSWFVITAPRIAEKYKRDMDNQLANIIRMSNEKTAPTASSSGVLDTGTSVS